METETGYESGNWYSLAEFEREIISLEIKEFIITEEDLNKIEASSGNE